MRHRIGPVLKPLAAAEHGQSPATTGDHDLNEAPAAQRHAPPLVPAAVLVPIIEHAAGPSVLLTQRSAHLRDHAGQVSFPGGRAEPHDGGPVATALREAEEEIGLDAARVEVAGLLDDYETGTRYLVTPVVGFVRPGFALRLDSFEVAEVFEVPLAYLLDPANHAIESREWRGVQRHYHAIRYEGRFIWGATAGMLMNLYRRVNGLLGPD